MRKGGGTIICYILCFTTFIAYGQHPSNKRINDIILVNFNGQKCDVAPLIKELDKCNPTAIGLNVLLSESKNESCDNQILQAIEDSHKVTLIEGLNNKLSDESFYLKALYTGETGLASKEGRITDFYYRIAEYKARYSFSFLMALQYDTSRAPQLVSKSFPKYYPLVVSYMQGDFTMLKNTKDISKNCKIIDRKIILVGNLESDSNDIHLCNLGDGSTTKTYGTVLLANVILEILEDLDTEDVKINKYSEYIRKQQMNRH